MPADDQTTGSILFSRSEAPAIAPQVETSGLDASENPSTRSWRAMAVVALAGLILRWWVMGSALGVLDSDEAVGGLIARHFLDGEVSVFLWGNAWGGTAEALVTAVPFALFGSSVLALKLVMVAFYAGGCVLTWRVGRRLLGEKPARFAAAFLWLYPGSLVLLSTKARLYYGAALVISLGIILVVLRLREQSNARDAAGLGLLLGLGLWTAPFVFYVAIPALAWLVWRAPRTWRRTPLVFPGALLGALPWIAFNLRNSFPSLREPEIPVDTSYLDRLGGFFTRLLPNLLGLRLTATGDWSLGPIGAVVYLAVLIGLLVLVWRTIRHPSPLELPLVILAGYPFIFAVPSSSYYVSEPRYGIVLAPVVALLVTAGLWHLKPPRPYQLGALAGAVVASAAAIVALLSFAKGAPGNHDIADTPLKPLTMALEAEGVDALYADYWIAYRLSFETREQIIASPIDAVRYPPYLDVVRRDVDADGETTIAVYEGAPKDRALRRTLDGLSLPYQRSTPGGFAVYTVEAEVTTDMLDPVKFIS